MHDFKGYGDTFREWVERYLVPMVPGATVVGYAKPDKSEKTARIVGDRLHLKASGWNDYLILTGFTERGIPIARAFVEAVRLVWEVTGILKKRDVDFVDAAANIPAMIVVRTVQDGRHEATLWKLLECLGVWGARTYEGERVSGAIGLDPGEAPEAASVSLVDVCRDDFSLVFGNGMDTLMVSDVAGGFHGARYVSRTANVGSHAPLRLGAYADWSKDGKMVLTLNRHGEIAVLSDGQLAYARRNNTWTWYDTERLRDRVPGDDCLRRAVAETCLDVSFGRTGGCLAVVRSGSNVFGPEMLFDEKKDVRSSSDECKVRALRTICRADDDGLLPFPRIDRAVRQELVAMDGATVVDEDGNLLTAGALVERLPERVSGGGRAAAASALSSLGFAAKISEDGYIETYEGGNVTLSFGRSIR